MGDACPFCGSPECDEGCKHESLGRPHSSPADLLDEFHRRFNYERTTDPSLRSKLHWEEHEELMVAIDDGELEAIAKELADVVYIAYGSAWSLGIDLEGALREVHASNMSKLDDNGEPVYREDGKVMKGPNYRPPDMSPFVQKEN